MFGVSYYLMNLIYTYLSIWLVSKRLRFHSNILASLTVASNMPSLALMSSEEPTQKKPSKNRCGTSYTFENT